MVEQTCLVGSQSSKWKTLDQTGWCSTSKPAILLLKSSQCPEVMLGWRSPFTRGCPFQNCLRPETTENHREPPRLFLVLLPGGSPSGPGHGISSPCLFLRCKSKTLRPKPELTMLARKLWGQCEDDRQEAPMPFPHGREEYTVWSWRKSPGWSDSEQGSMLHSTSGGCDKCVVSPQPDPPRAYSHAGDTVPTHERHLNYHTNAVCF